MNDGSTIKRTCFELISKNKPDNFWIFVKYNNCTKEKNITFSCFLTNFHDSFLNAITIHKTLYILNKAWKYNYCLIIVQIITHDLNNLIEMFDYMLPFSEQGEFWSL